MLAFIEGQGGQIEKSIGGAGAVVLELWTGISSVASRTTQLTGSLCTAVHWGNSSPPQHSAALCGQVLFYALSLVCNKNNKNTVSVDSVNQLCGAAQLTGSLCTGATALHRIVQHLARTLWTGSFTLRC